MFTIRAAPRRLCDGIDRRAFLTVGGLGALGLGKTSARASAPAKRRGEPASFGRARRCILLFLTGGPPQHDTWDLKPDAPAEIRGELKPIATHVPGISISELFPRLAQRAQHYCILRSLTHSDTVHTSAGYTVLTGKEHPLANSPGGASNVRPAPTDHPHLGSLVAHHRPSRTGLPAFVALPEIIRDAGVNEFPGQDAGFLGRRHGPLLIEADAEKKGFRFPELVLPADVTATRLQERRFLRQQLDRRLTALEARTVELEGCYDQAFGLIQSAAARRAFELDREPPRMRDAYGPHLFGQGCLLARRLVEADVAFVTVYWHYEGPDDSPVWDTHWNNFAHLRQRLMPPTDQAFSALLDDLGQRGLLEDTLVLCLGEFGRTPRINAKGGRDHWPHVQSLVLAGAGIPGGCVYGASDKRGAYPAERPVTPADLAATVLHLLGIPRDGEIHDRTGQPVRVCLGQPLVGLLGK